MRNNNGNEYNAYMRSIVSACRGCFCTFGCGFSLMEMLAMKYGTLKDLCRRTGASRPTVRKALRGDEPVTENRQMIRDIAVAEFGAYKIRVIRL